MINAELIEKGYSLTLPIINPKRRRLFYVFSRLSIAGVIFVILGFIIPYFYHNDLLNRVLLGSGILLVLANSVLTKFMDFHETEGDFILSKNGIQMEYKNIKDPEEINGSDMACIKFIYSGFEGEGTLGTQLISFETGLENYITIYAGTRVYRVELLIESKQRAEYLLEFLNFYRSVYGVQIK